MPAKTYDVQFFDTILNRWRPLAAGITKAQAEKLAEAVTVWETRVKERK